MSGPADLRLPFAVPFADGGHRISSQLGPIWDQLMLRSLSGAQAKALKTCFSEDICSWTSDKAQLAS
jgi:hypothetical protein